MGFFLCVCGGGGGGGGGGVRSGGGYAVFPVSFVEDNVLSSLSILVASDLRYVGLFLWSTSFLYFIVHIEKRTSMLSYLPFYLPS